MTRLCPYLGLAHSWGLLRGHDGLVFGLHARLWVEEVLLLLLSPARGLVQLLLLGLSPVLLL